MWKFEVEVCRDLVTMLLFSCALASMQTDSSAYRTPLSASICERGRGGRDLASPASAEIAEVRDRGVSSSCLDVFLGSIDQVIGKKESVVNGWSRLNSSRNLSAIRKLGRSEFTGVARG